MWLQEVLLTLPACADAALSPCQQTILQEWHTEDEQIKVTLSYKILHHMPFMLQPKPAPTVCNSLLENNQH